MTQSKKHVLLTGGSGLVGKYLTPLLTERGWSVTHFDTRDPQDGNEFVQGDLRDADALGQVAQGKDAICHVAALHGQAWKQAGDDVGFEVNVVGTKNVLEAAARENVARVVFTSSIWATGHDNPTATRLPIDESFHREPAEMYGLTKILGETMCRYYSQTRGMSTIVLRPGGVGPTDRHKSGEAFYLVGGVDVRDVAKAHALALEAPEDIRHEVFIITADSALCRIDRQEYLSDPASALEKAVPGTKALVESGQLSLPASPEYCSVEKARRVLGYDPQYNFHIQSDRS